jgi:hypothetical protein
LTKRQLDYEWVVGRDVVNEKKKHQAGSKKTEPATKRKRK